MTEVKQFLQKVINVMCNIGISDDHKKTIARRLDKVLSDEYILFTKLFKYHWNVVGPSFGPLHALFQDQYELLFKMIDDIAERTRALGHISIGTLQEFQQHARLQEQPGVNPHSNQMIVDLVHDHEIIIRNLRDDIVEIEAMGDAGSVDFLSGLLRDHEKMAWLLRAHLEN